MKNNIIDFDIARLNVRYDSDFDIEDTDKWLISKPNDRNKFNLKNLFPQNPKFYKSILLDLRYFFNSEKEMSSISTLICHFSYLKPFVKYLFENEKQVKSFSEIDYEVLFRYVNYLKTEKSAYTKYRRLKSFLGLLIKYKKININNDLKNKNYPIIKFNTVSKEKIKHYDDEEYEILRKVILHIIKEYLDNEETSIKEHIFVKACYWMFSLMTGFNKKGLDTLTFDSISIIEEDKINKKYLIIGEKNRSVLGYQSCHLVIFKERNHLFEIVMEKLKIINSKYRDEVERKYQNSLWVYFNNVSSSKSGKVLNYDGSISNFQSTKKFKEIFSFYSNKNIRISSFKNRKKWAMEMFDISKSEQVVSKMMNHKNLDVTIGHYLKYEISSEIKLKFNIFQELMNSFARNENFKDWIKFQEAFGVKELNVDYIYKGIHNGDFNTSLGNCINKIKSDGSLCQSYFNCFNCKNFSIIGEKDIWKIISFRESLMEETIGKHNYISHYEPIIMTINNILVDFDKKIIIEGKNLLKKHGRHPFWRNKQMIKSLIKDFEMNKV